MSELFYMPFRSTFHQNGPALQNGTLYFYSTGTNSLANVYADAALSVARPNPLLADAAGRFATPIYLDPAVVYRVVLKDSAGIDAINLDPYVSIEQPQMLSPYDFGAQGGYDTLPEARNGVDDTAAIEALLAAWTANAEIVPNFGGRYWKVSRTIRFVQAADRQAAYFIAGMFVAANGSSGENLLEISMPNGAWQGKLGAYGTDGQTYAARTWSNGIFINSSNRIRAPMGWVAESFKRDGMAVYAPNNTENNIALMIGPGRAESCGSALGQDATLLTQGYSAVTNTGGSGSTAQRSVLTMTGNVPTEIKVDDVCYHALTPQITAYVGDGVTKTFSVGSIHRWHNAFSKIDSSVALGDYKVIPTNTVEFTVAPPSGVAFRIITTPYEPFVVTAISGAQLTLFPQIPLGLTAGTVVYGHGAGLRVVGANTASCHFGLVEGFRCGSLLHVGGLYTGKFDGVQSQVSGCALTLGNPVTSASYGGQLGYFHSESTVYDIISVSTAPLRMDLPAPSAMGVQTSAATGELFGQVFKLAPRLSTGGYSPRFTLLSGLTLRGVHSPIPMQAGPTRGVALETANLSNYPHENFIAQRTISATTLSLKWYDVLDEKISGYNHCAAFLFGTGANSGPASATTVVIDAADSLAGVKVNGATSVAIPACTYPLHIVAVMDNKNPAAKNWLVTWREMRLKEPTFVTAKLTDDPPSISAMGTWSRTMAVPGAVLGGLVTVSFSNSLQGMILSGYVSAAATVTLVLFNPTAAAINLPSGAFSAVVREPI